MQQHSTSKVCVLLPAFNEARHIEQCLRATQVAFPHALILVVDNNSTDDTAAIARSMGALVVTETVPGKGRAVSAGVKLALEEGCSWIALHDADNEYHAGHLATLVDACRAEDGAGQPALVMGVGLREVALGHVLWRSLLANFVARTALRLALRKTPPSDILTGARVMNASLARMLFDCPDGKAPYKGFELETALTRKALAAGAKLVSAPVRYSPRAVTEKKIKAWDMLGILKAAWYA
ncbi:glycosyltransferase family 2 protein [Burkholderia ubonensis]|uniref:glycosyltransferase family 2 protein n=1 Tax=Burkholderia ubonensis TaxID=101571 RepID=UPI000B1BC87B|nr:glycosyltransferase family 2 protein [Burkholderia ubonensis]